MCIEQSEARAYIVPVLGKFKGKVGNKIKCREPKHHIIYINDSTRQDPSDQVYALNLEMKLHWWRIVSLGSSLPALRVVSGRLEKGGLSQ